MTTAPLPATPDLMTMLCRIGAGMREAVPSGVYLHFLLIGAMCPRFGALLQAWLFVEERLADRLDAYEADLLEDDGDADQCSGWLSQEGPVWRWRHVTRFGSRLIIPVFWFVERNSFDGIPLTGCRPRSVRVRVLSPVSRLLRFAALFFCPAWLAGSNCGLIVPTC